MSYKGGFIKRRRRLRDAVQDAENNYFDILITLVYNYCHYLETRFLLQNRIIDSITILCIDSRSIHFFIAIILISYV